MSIWTIILWAIVIIAGIELLLSWIFKTDDWFANFMIVCCSAFCLMFVSSYPKQVKLALCIMMVCIVLCWILIWCRAIKARDRERVIYRRLYNSFVGARRIVAITMAVLAVCMLPGVWKKDDVKDVIVTYGDEYRFSENVETMLKLQEEEWKLLTLEEKVDVMQCVAFCEARYLGLWTPITVQVADIEQEKVLGCYDDSVHTVYLDREHVVGDLAEEVLESVCHEVYHAYSRRMVDVYYQSKDEMKNLRFFNTASQYAENIENYISAEEDEEGYLSQKFEADAYAYGEFAASEYYRMIEEYLEENGNGE